MPRRRVKRLFWNPLRLSSKDDEAEDTVWAAIDREGAPVDGEELEDLFAERSILVTQLASSSDVAKKKIRVFSDQRRQQICVMLARLPAGICEAVARMDAAWLDKDQVGLLLGTLPSAQEIQQLVDAKRKHCIDDVSVFDTAEDFMLSLIAVPRFGLRLQVWDFENSFQERVETLMRANLAISAGCRFVLGSERLRHLLGVTLYAGNYLNGGTPRGRADGFDISILAQMRALKASRLDRETSLVDYIAKVMDRKYPEELSLVFCSGGEAEQIRRAARYKLSDLSQELEMQTRSSQQLLRRLKEAGPEDEVLEKHREVLAMSVAELEGLHGRLLELEERYARLCAWFRMEASARRTSDEFFGIWATFLHEIGQAYRAVETQRRRDGRRRCSRSQNSRRRISRASLRLGRRSVTSQGGRTIASSPEQGPPTTASDDEGGSTSATASTSEVSIGGEPAAMEPVGFGAFAEEGSEISDGSCTGDEESEEWEQGDEDDDDEESEAALSFPGACARRAASESDSFALDSHPLERLQFLNSQGRPASEADSMVLDSQPLESFRLLDLVQRRPASEGDSMVLDSQPLESFHLDLHQRRPASEGDSMVLDSQPLESFHLDLHQRQSTTEADGIAGELQLQLPAEIIHLSDEHGESASEVESCSGGGLSPPPLESHLWCCLDPPQPQSGSSDDEEEGSLPPLSLASDLSTY